MTRNDWLSGLLGVAFLLTLILMPAQTGGSGITPVKRWKN